MTKRLALLSLVFVFALSAFARSEQPVTASPARVPDLAECRGVLTAEILDGANAATEDPAATYKKQHRTAGAMPASVKCASRLWQTRQPASLTRETRGLKPAPHIKPEKKQRATVSRSPRALDNDKDKGNGNGNGNAYGRSKDHGKPTEIEIKKAGSSKADLRTLPQEQPQKEERPEREGPEPNPVTLEPDDDPGADQGAALRPVSGLALTPHVNVQAPPTIMNFNGLDFQNWGNGHPPDTNGDVGPDYYIQSINTSLGIYRKSDGVRVAAFSFNTFMSQGHFGNLCDTNNFGDPVVLYDTFEDRWVVTDFAFQLNAGAVVNPPGAFQCIAVSMTGDPVTGGWNYYSINTAGGLGDYPKFGIWPDGLYMSANMFDYPAGGGFLTARAYAFNKAQMYAGSPTVQVVSFNVPGGDFALLPSNARLQTGTPPAGSPNYFLSTWQFTNAIGIYKFHVDWNNISLTTFTGPDVVLNPTGWPNAAVANAPSLGGNSLDVLQIRAMMQNQYSNIGGVESLWATHTVRRSNTTGFAAPRFYQIGVNNGTVAANTTQGATFDPDAANVMHRFMPSLAVDRAGNMALGYSTSSSTTKPAMKYAGRLSTDPANTLSQTEQVLIQGTGTQTGNCGGAACTRWGDYSAMSLDPDGCTFWNTNMFYAVDGLNHQTRIGSFKFNQCTPVGAGGSLSGTVTFSPGGAPVSGATVALGSRVTTTNGSGANAFLSLPAGTYPGMTASYPGYTSASASNIVVIDANTTTRNFALSAAATNACLTDTTQADFLAGIPTNVNLLGSPGDVKLANPDVIDQQNLTVTSSGFGFNATNWAGQTFIPAVTGQLTRADLDLFCSGCTGTIPNLTVSIRAAAGSPAVPIGPDLATGTIAGFSSGAGGYFAANFTTPATITAGSRYAVIVRSVANPTLGTYAYVCSCSNGVNTINSSPYANGQRVTSANSGGTWTADTTTSGRDLGFKIFVNTGFAPSGNIVSSVKDSNPPIGASPIWTSLSWNAAVPPSTTVRFQAAASSSPFGPFNFVGPDGTAATFFANGGSLSQFNGNRYLRYTALLNTSSGAVTPTLNDATVCFVDTLPTSLSVAPATGTYGSSASLSATLTSLGSPVSGKTVAFTVNGNPAGSAVTDGSGVATTSYNLGTLAVGSYPIGASVTGDSFYASASGSNTLSVTKANATINVTPYSVTYDGNPHTATGTATGVFSEALAGLDLSGTTHTNAGTTNDGWTFTNANYNDASGTVTDSIAKANATIAVTPYTVTYDGLPHTATGTATGVQGENLAGLDLSGTTHTDAGDYTDAWTFTDATGNYNNAGGTVLDRIAKSSAVTIVVNGYTGVYDALPHGATGSATGVLGENLTSLLSLGAAFTNVPGGTAAWSFAGNNDYSPASGSVNIVITKAPLTVKANNASRLYGSPNPAFSASYSGFQGADTFAGSVTGAPSLTTTATQFSATGTYVITAAAGTLASNNYSFNFVNGTLSIQLSGLVGLNSVSFGAQKGLADSFNSSGGYPATQGNSAVILSNGPIEIGGATINGSLVSTQGSIQLQPGTIVIGNVRAGTTVSNKGTVNGTIAQNQTSAALVAPAVPDCGAFSPNSGLGGDYSYSNGDLKVTGNNTVTLANGSYCFHNVTLTGQARLQVTGPVAISLTGTLSAGGGSFANTTGSPSNLKIASSYAGNGGVSLNGGAEAYLTVYAPTTDVTITGGSSLFGAVLGKTLTANGNPAVHYDTLLPNIWAAFFGF